MIAHLPQFLGWRNDRGALLAASTFVAFPSRYEPFGTVTVDAWAASRPLVAADAVGPAAYVQDGVNGLPDRRRTMYDALAVMRWRTSDRRRKPKPCQEAIVDGEGTPTLGVAAFSTRLSGATARRSTNA